MGEGVSKDRREGQLDYYYFCGEPSFLSWEGSPASTGDGDVLCAAEDGEEREDRG